MTSPSGTESATTVAVSGWSRSSSSPGTIPPSESRIGTLATAFTTSRPATRTPAVTPIRPAA